MEEVINLIWNSFYFMLPAFLANAAPVLTKKINFLDYRVDFGYKLGKRGIFGGHKTWRGLFFATLFGIIVFQIQRLGSWQSFINYSEYSFSQGIILGFLFGFGAIIGDLVESFFKRRLNIKPGAPFIPFDQIDLAIGAMVFTYRIHPFNFIEVITILSLTFCITIFANLISYAIKIRDTKI